MIKVVTLITRNPDLSPAEFRDYWENTHVPMIKLALPGLSHYCGCFPAMGDDPVLPVNVFSCDAIVELGWPDSETMNRDMTSPAFNSPEREESSARLMDLPKVRAMTVEVVDVI